MKKLILALALILAIPATAFARTTTSYDEKASNSSVLQVGNSGSTGATIYTGTMDIGDSSLFAVAYRVTSPSWTNGVATPSVTIFMQQSFTIPATESTADASWSTISTIVSSYAGQKGNWFNQSLTVIPERYIRFGLFGTSPNATDTTVQIKVTKQYDV